MVSLTRQILLGSRSGGVCACVVSLTLFSLLPACSGEASGNAPERREIGRTSAAAKLKVVKVETVEHRQRWKVRGVLEPGRTAGAAFIVGGRLAKIHVSRGDRVTEGQVLARLDAAEVGAGAEQARAAIAAAETQVQLAEDGLRRLESLEAEKAIAESELVKVRLQHEAALAMRERARAALKMVNVKSGQHVLRAPMAGTVLEVPERLGEIIGPGIPQFEIADLEKLRFRGSLPGEAAGRVVLGQEALVHLQGSKSITGRVSYVSPALTADTHRLPFEVEVDPPADLQGVANSYVHVELRADSAGEVARIPTTALKRGEETTVFVVTAQKSAKRHEVTVVGSEGDRSLVEGLEPGTLVIDLPPVDLEDGASVER